MEFTAALFTSAKAHLHRYLAEFDFRYSNRIGLKIDDVKRSEIALQGFKGKRLTRRSTCTGLSTEAPAH
jgi:hypothetical protein